MRFNRNESDWSLCRRKVREIPHSRENSPQGLKLLFLLVSLLMCQGFVYGKYGGGSGNSADPYLISAPEDLAQIGRNPSDWDKCFKLTSDVNMSDYNAPDGNMSLTPIGILQWEPYSLMPFKGVFNGNNKQILNLSITRQDSNFVGLFGYVQGCNAQISDLTLVNTRIEAGTSMYVGAIAGKLSTGCILRCSIIGGSITGGDYTGGLVGYNTKGLIINSHSQANVSGQNNVGGIAGYYGDPAISMCSFEGQVSGANDVGGLVGESNADIINCYADGNVLGTANKVAGLVGTLRGQLNGCFSKGRVSGNNEVGGLVGRNMGQVQDCYSQITVEGNYYVGGLAGLLYDGGTISRCYTVCDVDANESMWWVSVGLVEEGMITSSFWTWSNMWNQEMTMQVNYTEAGWDFVGESDNGSKDLWEICEGMDYPRLSWEKPPIGDFVCPEGVDMEDIAILLSHWLKNTQGADLTGPPRDYIVDFRDLAVLANAWNTSPGMQKWNANCDIWPDGGDGVIGIGDLSVLADSWLGPGSAQVDIGPEGKGDGIVNFIDFAVAAKNYLNQD